MALSAGTRLYLASRSSRRRELLKQIGVTYEMLLLREHSGRNPDVDESPLPGERPDAYVRRVCVIKAEIGWEQIMQRRLPKYPVLAADTTVCVDEEILGKPRDAADAARMLGLLSGREHRVLCAVAMKLEARCELMVNESLVRFRELTPADIRTYIDSGEPMDKAGAYAIQGRAAAFITNLQGSYSGVMGLPLFETAQLLAKF